MADISADQREQVNKIYQKLAQIKNDNSGQALHKKVQEQCAVLLEIVPNDKVAVQTNLTCLIKLKSFDTAIECLQKIP